MNSTGKADEVLFRVYNYGGPESEESDDGRELLRDDFENPGACEGYEQPSDEEMRFWWEAAETMERSVLENLEHLAKCRSDAVCSGTNTITQSLMRRDPCFLLRSNPSSVEPSPRPPVGSQYGGQSKWQSTVFTFSDDSSNGASDDNAGELPDTPVECSY